MHYQELTYTPMSNTSTTESSPEIQLTAAEQAAERSANMPEPPPSYVKLAMRNMVKKGGKSLFHFTLTTAGLLAVLVGLAYLTR